MLRHAGEHTWDCSPSNELNKWSACTEDPGSVHLDFVDDS